MNRVGLKRCLGVGKKVLQLSLCAESKNVIQIVSGNFRCLISSYLHPFSIFALVLNVPDTF